ncbi:MAG: 4Fe-4S binding protein [Eubacterium sp.]|nr:4Fe-4S binding protein [Eubacterium sp.]
MNPYRKTAVTGLICIALMVIAYFSHKFPFFEYAKESYTTTRDQLFTLDWLLHLLPLILILALSAFGILLCIAARKRMLRKNKAARRFAWARSHSKGQDLPGQKLSAFMVVRWLSMILFSFFMIFGGILLGVRYEKAAIPVFSCPVNMNQLTESSCYYLSHLSDLFSLPAGDIILFIVSTIGFAVILGRVICGFLCPMGLVQDLMDVIRRRTKTEGIIMNDRMYKALVPIRWTLVFLMMGLTFAGGNFCNFCPAVTLSPVLAGLEVSLFASGFVMIFVLIGSFFKRRFFCTICPLGYLIGLCHKISPFRIKKDCTACTECGACYDACPMGIKAIYKEREKADVTDITCIMCGECVRKCPEDRALCVTCFGKPVYTASREKVVANYKKEKNL